MRIRKCNYRTNRKPSTFQQVTVKSQFIDRNRHPPLSIPVGKRPYLVMHLSQIDGESWKANYFGVGVGIGVGIGIGIGKVLFDPDSDSDPDPDPIHLSEVHNQ